jgi:hypothetical protein
MVCIPLIPATGEAEVGESWPENSQDKVSSRLYLKNKLKAKELGRQHDLGGGAPE